MQLSQKKPRVCLRSHWPNRKGFILGFLVSRHPSSSYSPSTEKPHPPLGGQSPVYRAPPTHPPDATPQTLPSQLPNLGGAHLQPTSSAPGRGPTPFSLSSPPPKPLRFPVLSRGPTALSMSDADCEGTRQPPRVLLCWVFLFFFFVFGAPPAGSPAHLLGSRPPRSGFIRPPALLLRGIPLFSWSRPMQAPGFLSASARLEPNLTRQQPIPHALQTRDREQYELGGCPGPNVVLGSVHGDPLAAAPAFAKKGSGLSRDEPSSRAAEPICSGLSNR